MRLATNEGGEHHVTMPTHNSLRVGTLAGILDEVAKHFGISRVELLAKMKL